MQQIARTTEEGEGSLVMFFLKNLALALINALGFSCAVFIGIWIDLIYLISPKWADKLTEICIAFVEGDDDD